MENINFSSHFSIGYKQSEVDFVDIILTRDIKLFIDPKSIEINTDNYSKKMSLELGIFWREFLLNINDRSFLKRLCSGFSEPNETRFGYSKNKSKGNALGNVLSEILIDSILSSKAVKTGSISSFSDLQIVTNYISRDRISDITTKIVKAHLIEFTQAQCKLYKVAMTFVVQDDIFDMKTMTWKSKKVELPIYEGKPIILVPKNIVQEGYSPMNLGTFYTFALNNYVIHDKLKMSKVRGSGKKGRIYKKDIKAKYPNSKNILNKWILDYPKLLVNYKSSISGKISAISNENLEIVVYRDIA